MHKNTKNAKFPKTRYQGSKYKLSNWIWENIKDLSFDTVLDVFGGTGSVSYMLKQNGKQVVYNDILKFNHAIGKALIENNHTILNGDDIEFILTKRNIVYPTFIEDNFNGIFYLDEENKWLDMVIKNIKDISDEYKQSIALFALFQSCIIKRPYNLFHRSNLHIRTQDVERSFGNKKTWDTSFEIHFRNFVAEANNAVFDNNRNNLSINYDAQDVPLEKLDVDLVYIDSPYISSKGVGTDYIDFYHFLEGIMNYDNWNEIILNNRKHKPLKGRGESPWIKKNKIHLAFDELFNKYKDSILVVSYRDDGIPSKEDIIRIMKKYKKDVECISSIDYKYVLSKKESKEILIIGK